MAVEVPAPTQFDVVAIGLRLARIGERRAKAGTRLDGNVVESRFSVPGVLFIPTVTVAAAVLPAFLRAVRQHAQALIQSLNRSPIGAGRILRIRRRLRKGGRHGYRESQKERRQAPAKLATGKTDSGTVLHLTDSKVEIVGARLHVIRRTHITQQKFPQPEKMGRYIPKAKAGIAAGPCCSVGRNPQWMSNCSGCSAGSLFTMIVRPVISSSSFSQRALFPFSVFTTSGCTRSITSCRSRCFCILRISI